MANIGIEIEFVGLGSDTYNLAHTLSGNGFDVRNDGYHHESRPFWKVVTDGSVWGGAEIVSPVLSYDTDLPMVRQVLETLKEKGARADERCGVHVHVDHTWLNTISSVKRQAYFAFITAAYQKVEPTFDLTVREDRNYNSYCRSTIGKSCRDIRSNRYHKLNLAAFDRHGTVEYRHLQGTVNADTVIAWIKLVHTFNANVKARFDAMNA